MHLVPDGSAATDNTRGRVTELTTSELTRNQSYDFSVLIIDTTSANGPYYMVAVRLDSDYGAVGVVIPFPIPVALADLLPECETMTAEELAGSVEIQTLDNAGYTVDSYVWNGVGWEGDDSTEFAAGAGLWVFNQIGDSAEVRLRIPAPEF